MSRILHALFREQVAFLGEGGLDRLRRGGDGRARTAGLHALQIAGQAIDHREEDDVERLLRMDHVQQIVDVRNAELGRKARVDRAALGAFLVELLAGVVGEDEVLGLEAERCEVAGEDRRQRIHVQHARHADADLGALLHQLDALLLRRGERELGQRIGDERGIRHAEDGLGGDLPRSSDWPS